MTHGAKKSYSYGHPSLLSIAVIIAMTIINLGKRGLIWLTDESPALGDMRVGVQGGRPQSRDPGGSPLTVLLDMPSSLAIGPWVAPPT